MWRPGSVQRCTLTRKKKDWRMKCDCELRKNSCGAAAAGAIIFLKYVWTMAFGLCCAHASPLPSNPLRVQKDKSSGKWNKNKLTSFIPKKTKNKKKQTRKTQRTKTGWVACIYSQVHCSGTCQHQHNTTYFSLYSTLFTLYYNEYQWHS